MGLQLGKEMAHDLLVLRVVSAEAPDALEQIVLEKTEIFLLCGYAEFEGFIDAREYLPRGFSRLDERAVEIEEDSEGGHRLQLDTDARVAGSALSAVSWGISKKSWISP